MFRVRYGTGSRHVAWVVARMQWLTHRPPGWGCARRCYSGRKASDAILNIYVQMLSKNRGEGFT